MRSVIAGAAGLLASGILALAGHAEMPADAISAFNRAVQANEPGQIIQAASQLGAAAIAHPEDPQSSIAAFEAANQLCLRNACADAQPITQFLLGLDETAGIERGQVEILSAFADWSASDKKKSAAKAFEAVLKEHVATEPTAMTLAAYEGYVVDAIGTQKWRMIHNRAVIADQHMAAVRDIIPVRWVRMALLVATAKFNDNQSLDALQKVADLENWLYTKRHIEHAENLDQEYHTVSAWGYALMAYFKSGDASDQKRARNIYEATHEMRENHVHPESDPGHELDGPPLCTGKVVQPPRPRYPRGAARKGYVGAVLLTFDFVDGEPANYRVLAAVPDTMFETVTLEAMKDFRWEWDEEQEHAGCTKTKTGATVYPFEYVMR